MLAKAKPGTLNYTVPGILQRVFFDNFNKKHGLDLVGIPFKGGGDVLTGVLSGNIPIAFIGGANFAPYVREGKMVALAGRCSPVMNLFYNTQVIVASTSLGVHTLDELAALAKAKPSTLNHFLQREIWQPRLTRSLRRMSCSAVMQFLC